VDSFCRCLHSRTCRMKQNVIDQLRKAIEASGESQLAIGEATGINQGNLNRFLRGERGRSLENFAKLCQ
jgi:transcriptional regulator with XRE-family HTH domain